MKPRENWIWLPENEYPAGQTTSYSVMSSGRKGHYTVARFGKTYRFGKAAASLRLRFSGDTAFRLFVEKTLLCRGPASAGGDFLFNALPRPNTYAYELTLTPEQYPQLPLWTPDGILSLSAEVRMQPVRTCEFSQGHGGFFLDGRVNFSDGTYLPIGTDETWDAQVLGNYVSPGYFDSHRHNSPVIKAMRTPNIWHTETAPIPPCENRRLIPADEASGTFRIPAGESVSAILTYDKIYAGCLYAAAQTADGLNVSIRCSENGEYGTEERICFAENGEYRGFELHSFSQLILTAINTGSAEALLTVAADAVCYPVSDEAVTTTDDPELNQVLRLCAHTLRYCRQSIHLDSPRHCEPLACTGDYYIETMMTVFTFGDLRLAALDTRRTAAHLRDYDGRMFHTAYSLIWVQMLWEIYYLSGEYALLTDCEDALTLLLERFRRYIGETGLIETPPDYMFIDWLYPDGISTHHPPKALGQTCMNLFFYGALHTAAKIYRTLREPAMAINAEQQADAVKSAILTHLYDPERELFFEGLNTPTPEELLNKYMPQNTEKRYYRRHANILAAYFRILPEDACRALLRRTVEDDSLGDVQPYFRHFLLDAVYRCGLRDALTLRLLDDWKASVRACDKGLAEGFVPPQPGYVFDHSHAWGGTPAYALPLALTGLSLPEPGWKKVRLCPSLLGLGRAYTEIPTPYGKITVSQKAGERPVISVPDGITLLP